MQENSKRKKVLCPVEKDGKTFWKLLGAAYVNKDNSINVYLDSLPINGKLHLRDWDEPSREPRADQQSLGLRAVPGPTPTLVAEDMPF
jgi:hypothetical protein